MPRRNMLRDGSIVVLHLQLRQQRGFPEPQADFDCYKLFIRPGPGPGLAGGQCRRSGRQRHQEVAAETVAQLEDALQEHGQVIMQTGVQDFLVIRYQMRMMQLAMEALERCRAEERMISSSTMGVSRSTFERVVKKVRDFRAHLAEMVSQDEHPERVYQLTISMIPLSQKPEAKP